MFGDKKNNSTSVRFCQGRVLYFEHGFDFCELANLGVSVFDEFLDGFKLAPAEEQV